jgi:hypothetical protein
VHYVDFESGRGKRVERGFPNYEGGCEGGGGLSDLLLLSSPLMGCQLASRGRSEEVWLWRQSSLRLRCWAPSLADDELELVVARCVMLCIGGVQGEAAGLSRGEAHRPQTPAVPEYQYQYQYQYVYTYIRLQEFRASMPRSSIRP